MISLPSSCLPFGILDQLKSFQGENLNNQSRNNRYIYIFRWSGTYCTFTSSTIGVTLLYSAFILVAHFPPHSKQQALPWSGSFSWTKSELLHQHHSSHRDLLPVLWSCTWFAAAPSQCEVWLLSGWHLLSRKYCWYNHESKMRGPITVDNAAFLF